MENGNYYLKGNKKASGTKFTAGSILYIVFDGVEGWIRFFENDVERKFLDLGSDFVANDIFFSVELNDCGHETKVELLDKASSKINFNQLQP